MIFKEVPSIPGCTVDSFGDIYFNGVKRAPQKSGPDRNYRIVSIRSKKYNVHRLVLEAYVGRCPIGMQACHNNGIAWDNRPENLRWDTKKNNEKDKLLHGTRGFGEKSHNSKISDKNAQIIVDCAPLVKVSHFAEKFGISRNLVRLIAVGGIRVKKENEEKYSVNKEVFALNIKKVLSDGRKIRSERNNASKNKLNCSLG